MPSSLVPSLRQCSTPIQSGLGAAILPGVGAYDAGSAAIAEFIFILPFFLGRQFLRSSEDNAEILRIMVIAGLAYPLPMLFEVRMSPQLHTWIYGYFRHPRSCKNTRRRFPAGRLPWPRIASSFLYYDGTVAAAALWRTQTHIVRLPPGGITAYLSFVLVLCKTSSALVYASVLVPLVRWANPRLQLRVACIFVIIALAYPMLRVADLIPTTSILEAARAVDTDRADSLGTRFYHEHCSSTTPGSARGLVGAVLDAVVSTMSDGTDISITDGYWINIMSDFGLIGFFATSACSR